MGGLMIKIENFKDLASSGIAYGGHSGSKKKFYLKAIVYRYQNVLLPICNLLKK